MKKWLFILSLITSNVYSQDSLLSYSRVLYSDSLTKEQIFDKVNLWCSKRFADSKSAINVSNRESGLLSGKANLFSTYKIPSKKDSTDGFYFSDYYFDWLIEVKDKKLKFTATEIKIDAERHLVKTSPIPPIKIMFQSKEKTVLQWKFSKEYFIRKLNSLLDNLNTELAKRESDW